MSVTVELTDAWKPAPQDEGRLEYVRSLLGDVAGKTVLDLGARVGYFSHALAEAGARVTAVEGRPENVALIPAHPNLRVIEDDVRSVTLERHGHFDIVLCLGILYHLGARDAWNLLRNVAEMANGQVIIDTHVGTDNDREYEIDGEVYHGDAYLEDASPWSSIGNKYSFWFGRDDLLRLVRRAGLQVVADHRSKWRWPRGERWWVIATKPPPMGDNPR